MHWDERNNLWVISKYEDVSYVERQPELFCSGQGIRPKGGGAGNLSIVSLDDPEHARQRRLVSRGFTPSRINQMFDHIRELARGLVDAVAARGECDFVEDIAKPLPLIVIAELLGLPVEDRQQLGEWSDTMMSAEGAEDDDRSATAARGDGVGRLRHLPRRAARGPARASEGRPDLDPPAVGRRRRAPVPRGRAAVEARRGRPPDERPLGRRAADVPRAAARRRQRDDAQRACPAVSTRCRGFPTSSRSSSPTCRSSTPRPRRSCATCRR